MKITVPTQAAKHGGRYGMQVAILHAFSKNFHAQFSLPHFMSRMAHSAYTGRSHLTRSARLLSACGPSWSVPPPGLSTSTQAVCTCRVHITGISSPFGPRWPRRGRSPRRCVLLKNCAGAPFLARASLDAHGVRTCIRTCRMRLVYMGVHALGGLPRRGRRVRVGGRRLDHPQLGVAAHRDELRRQQSHPRSPAQICPGVNTPRAPCALGCQLGPLTSPCTWVVPTVGLHVALAQGARDPDRLPRRRISRHICLRTRHLSPHRTLEAPRVPYSSPCDLVACCARCLLRSWLAALRHIAPVRRAAGRHPAL